ncbi:hypothetical protein BDZ89DRAFT_1138792 [Hymenopellis radicata]|nr:hypothetical protein BDZ89DRAFT_1138792 [Hymenopellis radicata]
MATNVATPQTTQRALSPRLFLTTDDVKRDILTKWEAQEPFCVRFSVKSDALDELEQMIVTLPCSRDLRISYTFDDGLIIRWVPGGAHDAASRAFIRFVDEAFIGVLQPPQWPRNLYRSLGSTTHRIATPNKERKQPDECFYPKGATSPSVVVEVGASEHLAQLQTDAWWWLTSAQFQVKLVIIIVIAPPPPNSASNEPRITVEHWEMAEGDHHRRVPTQLHTSDWTDTVPNVGDYQLATEAFVPNSDTRARFKLPTFLSPTTASMQEIRESIIMGWRLDQDNAAAARANAGMY